MNSGSANTSRSTSDSHNQNPNTPPPFAQSAPYHFPIELLIWLLIKASSLPLWLVGHHTAALLAFFLPDPWMLWQILVPSSRGFGPTVSRFRTTQREVWLTIDDGPDPVTTPLVLDVLDRYSARATFFVIGDNVARCPELTAEIVRRGHSVANHTATHPANSFWRAGPGAARREIDQWRKTLLATHIPVAPFFRAPVGLKNPFLHRQLARRGLSLIAWSARGFDCIADPDTAERRIVRRIKPGAIILLHEGNGDARRVQLLDRILQHLQAQDYKAILPERTTLIE